MDKELALAVKIWGANQDQSPGKHIKVICDKGKPRIAGIFCTEGRVRTIRMQ